MPKIDLNKVPLKAGSVYPVPLDALMDGRVVQRLSDHAGLSQFGANIVHLPSKAMSSIRHWHENQDEFLVVLSGVLTLVDDNGETALQAGDCAAFPAGDSNGHHIVNKSERNGSFLVIGTRTETETAWYSDMDMKLTATKGVFDFTRKDGSPLDTSSEE